MFVRVMMFVRVVLITEAMAVRVVVMVKRDLVGQLVAEHGTETCITTYMLWRTLAAHMVVQTYHALGRGHDDIEIMADHQHREIELFTEALQQAV